MRALTRGERNASAGVILGLFAFLCILVSTLALTLSYRQQLTDLRELLAERCAARQVLDQRLMTAVKGDSRYYGQMLTEVETLEDLPDLTTVQLATLARQKQIIIEAKAGKDALAASEPSGSCSQYTAREVVVPLPAIGDSS